MKELDEMEKINAKLSAAVEEVTLEHFKKNEVSLLMSSSLDSEFCSCRFISVTKNVLFKDEIRRRPPVVNAACLLAFHINILFLLMNELDNYMQCCTHLISLQCRVHPDSECKYIIFLINFSNQHSLIVDNL